MTNKTKYQDFVKAGAPDLPKNLFYRISGDAKNTTEYGVAVSIRKKLLFGLYSAELITWQATSPKVVKFKMEDLIRLSVKCYDSLPSKYKQSKTHGDIQHWIGDLG